MYSSSQYCFLLLPTKQNLDPSGHVESSGTSRPTQNFSSLSCCTRVLTWSASASGVICPQALVSARVNRGYQGELVFPLDISWSVVVKLEGYKGQREEENRCCLV